MSPEWRAQLDVFTRLTLEQRIAWYGRAIHLCTIFARDTYVVGSEEIADPARLRRFNELIHRIAGRQVGLATKGEADGFDESFFEMMSIAAGELRVSAALLASIESLSL
ncbi:hypothetical protein [Methylosinus sp. LW3]|uniref:hypothetical protein n=1 Tax=Methylosinus sp. LW3 TaxID=107635 RepID=UPI000465B920|nr:hypothetical protein [Methylosinus sp. LW3]